MTKTATVPTSAAELEDMLNSAMTDSALKAQIFGGGPKALADWIHAYAVGMNDRDTSIAEQVKIETQRQFAEIFRANDMEGLLGQINRLNLSPDAPPVMSPKHYNNRAPGAKLDKMFNTWSQYMTLTWEGNKSQEAFAAQTEIKRIRNAYSSTIPSDGGFLVPEVLRAELLRVALERAIMRSRARVVPMETLSINYPMIDSTSNASSVYGGIVGYWTEEGGTLTDSSPKFGSLELRAKKLTLYSEIPNELFTDSLISLEQFMRESYPEAAAWFEDIAFIAGTGVGQPLGWTNAPAAVSVAKEDGQAASTILWQNIVGAFSRMLPASIGRAIWVANINTFPQLAQMALNVGTGGSAVWIGEGQGAGAPPVTILGRPVEWTEKVPTLGTAGDINFVDPGYYVIGDRQAMQMETSIHYKFGNDKTAVRLIERVDGQPWIQSAITPQTGADTLSPFVKIATRA